MRIDRADWNAVEALLGRGERRAVIPLGCTEQHAGLSLATDSILAERVATEAAEPLGVPVFPVLPYGITPHFLGYPGTVSLRVETYGHVLRDILDSVFGHGFRHVLLVNGHGGNAPAQPIAAEWLGRASFEGGTVALHNWWNAPRTWDAVQQTDPVASHASWMENFPWTRLADAKAPDGAKPPVDFATLRAAGPARVRAQLGDGNFGGRWQRADEEMHRIWSVAVAETRAMIEALGA